MTTIKDFSSNFSKENDTSIFVKSSENIPEVFSTSMWVNMYVLLSYIIKLRVCTYILMAFFTTYRSLGKHLTTTYYSSSSLNNM